MPLTSPSPFLCRWGFTALDDALRFEKQDVVKLLKSHMVRERPDFFQDKETPSHDLDHQDTDSTDSEQEGVRRE